MKINFLVVFMLFGHLSYASFPVNEKEKSLISENLEIPAYDEEKKIWGNLSFYSSILSFLVIPNPFSIVLAILSIIFGIIGLTKKPNWKAVTGLILGLISVIVVALFVGMVILSGGFGG